jgi:type IV pilus assembly protein PilX
MKRASQKHSHQRGMVLITALLLLIVVTILALGLFRSFGLDEKIAGNLREKHRALNAAQTAEQYAEWWLTTVNAPSGVNCTAPLAAPTVCSNALTSLASLALPNAVAYSYTPTVPSAMPLSQTGGQDSYYSAPAFYITYLGPWPAPGTSGSVYQIDAVGFAGTPDTAAIVESTFLLQSTVSNLTQNPEG